MNDTIEVEEVDLARADIILNSVQENQGSILESFKIQKEKALQLLYVLITFITGITATLFLKCNLMASTCTTSTNILWPSLIAISGFFLASVFIVAGFLFPKALYFKGDTYPFLTQENIINEPLDRFKMVIAREIQKASDHNSAVLYDSACKFQWAIYIVIATPIISILWAFIY